MSELEGKRRYINGDEWIAIDRCDYGGKPSWDLYHVRVTLGSDERYDETTEDCCGSYNDYRFALAEMRRLVAARTDELAEEARAAVRTGGGTGREGE